MVSAGKRCSGQASSCSGQSLQGLAEWLVSRLPPFTLLSVVQNRKPNQSASSDGPPPLSLIVRSSRAYHMNFVIILLRVLRIFPFGFGVCVFLMASIVPYGGGWTLLISGAFLIGFILLRKIIHKLHVRIYGVPYPALAKQWNL